MSTAPRAAVAPHWRGLGLLVNEFNDVLGPQVVKPTAAAERSEMAL
jgi:hypothetical protein